MLVTEIIVAHGHENICATHPTTLEITKDECLTIRGDCVIGVGADKSPAELSEDFRVALRQDGAKLAMSIEVDGNFLRIHATGSKRLSLNHKRDLVLRKSDFIDDRTIAIKADKSAADIPRAIISRLRNTQQELKIVLTVQSHSNNMIASKS